MRNDISVTRTTIIRVTICIGLIVPLSAVAATIHVDGTTCELGNAILAANTDLVSGGCTAGDGADVIVLDADVTLSAADTTHSSEIWGAYAGLPDVTSDITIQAGSHALIERDGALGCAEPEPAEFRFFNLTGAAASLTLQGLTLTNGCVNGTAGAILSYDGTGLSIDGCTCPAIKWPMPAAVGEVVRSSRHSRAR